MKVKNDLLGYKNLKIIQDTEMFNFSLDSVLLPNFVTISSNVKNILDIGTGNAPVPLILSTKTKANIIGVELQREVFELAVETIRINNLEKQIKIINEDINRIKEIFKNNQFELITCNPPFFKVKRDSNLNKNDYKTVARHEVKLNLNQICEISRKLLKEGGSLALVHRPERLAEIITIMQANKIEPKRVQFVYPKSHKNANIVLIEGTKNGKPGIKILPPLITHNDDGTYSNEVQKFFK